MTPIHHGARPADAGLQAFQRHRPRLFGLAYRMLGQRAEAEDLVQEVWLRWHDCEHAAIAQLQAAQQQRVIAQLQAERALLDASQRAHLLELLLQRYSQDATEEEQLHRH